MHHSTFQNFGFLVNFKKSSPLVFRISLVESIKLTIPLLQTIAKLVIIIRNVVVPKIE